MGLSIKSASEILKNAITFVTHTTDKITDFSVGSVTRTILESVSLQLEEFYFKIYDGLTYAIENSVFNAFGFEILSATYASGELAVEFKSPLTSEIKFVSGLTFCTKSTLSSVKYYALTSETIAAVGATSVTLTVQCTESGILGNCVANSITVMITANSLVSKIYNSSSFANGRAAETKAERKARFKKYITTLIRGTTDSIEYAVSTVSGITGVYVDDGYGVVKVYCHDANGELSDTLKSSVKSVVDSYRSGGVEVVVSGVQTSLINVSVNIILNTGYNTSAYKTTVYTGIYTYLYSFKVGDAFYLTSLIKYIRDLDSDAIVDVEILTPSSKIASSSQVLFRPGIINVTAETVGQ